MGRTAHIENDGQHLEEARVVDFKHRVHKFGLGQQVGYIAANVSMFVVL